MAAITLDTLLQTYYTRLALYQTAEAAILGGAQSYSIGNRSLSRADLEWISKQIKSLTSDILALQRGNRIKVQRVVPRDDA